MIWDLLNTITGNTDDNSDDDSFNSDVMDLYDDVLFQYTIVPKEQEISTMQKSESFASAFSDIASTKEYIPQPSLDSFHDGRSQCDGGSEASSILLLSNGTSNDDGLSYISDALSAMPGLGEEVYASSSYTPAKCDDHKDAEESCISMSGVESSDLNTYDEVIFNPSDFDDTVSSHTEEFTLSDSIDYFGGFPCQF